jgi:hypothetical protein
MSNRTSRIIARKLGKGADKRNESLQRIDFSDGFVITQRLESAQDARGPYGFGDKSKLLNRIT